MADNKFESMARWFIHSLKMQDRFIQNPIMRGIVNRGDIYACYLGENIGYEKSRLEARPCVVISCDEINHKSGNIIVAPLSKTIKYIIDPRTKHKALKYDWNYVLYQSKYKLNYDSIVHCEDMRCISKIRLGTYIDHVDAADMLNLKKRIKKALQT